MSFKAEIEALIANANSSLEDLEASASSRPIADVKPCR